MTLWLAKLIATPVFIIVASLLARRFGAKLGGLIAGLPLTSAPVSVFLAIEQGHAFAAEAAFGTLAGVAAIAAFCAGYAHAAVRRGCLAATAAGLTGYVIVAFPLGLFQPDVLAATGLVLTALILVLLWYPRAGRDEGARPTPRWGLPARAAVATAMVVAITAAAPLLGPYFSGLLAPFPVFATVLAAFTHAALGPVAAIRLLRGVVLASFGFAAFFVVVGTMLPSFGAGIAFAAATAAAVLVGWAGMRLDSGYS